jgi:glycosyltransferase involved in cell wall biosynthesis
MAMEVNIFDISVHLETPFKNELRTLIESVRPHLIHSHNAPNTLTLAALDCEKDIPVIHDVHEVLSIHHSGFTSSDTLATLAQYRAAEQRANEECDARVYATKGIKTYLEDRYEIEASHNLVFRNYPLQSRFPSLSPDNHPIHTKEEIHIVYIGCITDLVKNSHYYLKPIFQHIADQQIHIHIYPTTDEITRSNAAYRHLASSNDYIHFHQHMSRPSLLKTLPQYHYGWAGLNNATNHIHLDLALPNKVVEYIACCLPVLTFPHRTMAKFIETSQTGIVLPDIHSLRSRLNDIEYSSLRDNVCKQRHHFTIEQQIPDLLQLYNDLCPQREDVGAEMSS